MRCHLKWEAVNYNEINLSLIELGEWEGSDRKEPINSFQLRSPVSPTKAEAKNKKQFLAHHSAAGLFIFYKPLLIFLFALLDPLQHYEKLPV